MWSRLDELIELAPDRLVAEVTFGGRARYSGLTVEMHPVHMIEMRDARVVRWQIFFAREQALEAAGSLDRGG